MPRFFNAVSQLIRTLFNIVIVVAMRTMTKPIFGACLFLASLAVLAEQPSSAQDEGGLAGFFGQLKKAAGDAADALGKGVEVRVDTGKHAVASNTSPPSNVDRPQSDANTSSNADTGSTLLQWWGDSDYAPPIYLGAMHIRFGRNGNIFSRSGKLPESAEGAGNCDVVYLWHAKLGAKEKGKTMSIGEMEKCALLEYQMAVDRKHEASRDMNNMFDRQEMVTKYTKLIEERIEELRKHNRFYFKAYMPIFSPYDFNEKDFVIKIQFPFQTPSPKWPWEGNRYQFVGPGFSIIQRDVLQSTTYSVEQYLNYGLGTEGELARDLERIRTTGASKDINLDIMFTVKGASERRDLMGTGGLGKPTPLNTFTRLIEIDKYSLVGAYVGANGNLYSLSSGVPVK